MMPFIQMKNGSGGRNWTCNLRSINPTLYRWSYPPTIGTWFWSEWQDSNLWPTGSQPVALPDCATLRPWSPLEIISEYPSLIHIFYLFLFQYTTLASTFYVLITKELIYYLHRNAEFITRPILRQTSENSTEKTINTYWLIRGIAQLNKRVWYDHYLTVVSKHVCRVVIHMTLNDNSFCSHLIYLPFGWVQSGVLDDGFSNN